MRSKAARPIFSASRLRKPSPAARKSTSRSRHSSTGRACSSAPMGPATSRALRQEDRGACRHDDREEPARHAGERRSSWRRSRRRRPIRRGSPCWIRGRSSPISPIGRSSPISHRRAPTRASCASPNNYFSLEPYALALPHGDEDFRLAVDRALSHIYRSGEIAIVFAHTFGNQMQPSDILKTLYSVSALPD